MSAAKKRPVAVQKVPKICEQDDLSNSADKDDLLKCEISHLIKVFPCLQFFKKVIMGSLPKVIFYKDNNDNIC